MWGGVNLRKKNYKIGLEQFAQLHEWNIPDDLKNKLLKNFLYPAYLEYGKRCYERSLSENQVNICVRKQFLAFRKCLPFLKLPICLLNVMEA